MEPGQAQLITSLTVDGADRALDADGDVSLDADFSKIEASSFLEWGLTPRLTLVLQPVTQTVRQRDEIGETNRESGFASSQIAARWLLASPPSGAVSAQAALVAPGVAENVTDALLGEGGLAAEARLLAGRGWGDETRGGFLEGQLGYRWRSDDYPGEARFDASVGVRPSRDWMVIGQSFSIWGEGELAATGRDFRSHKAQLSVVRRINDRWSVQAGGFGTYAGRNVVEERAVFASIWMRFRAGSPFGAEK
jgi:hypothetical protein